MILVPVGQDRRVDPVAVFAKVLEIRQHEVDPGHVDFGKGEPGVDQQDPAVLFQGGHVPADFAEAPQEDQPGVVIGHSSDYRAQGGGVPASDRSR